MVVRLMNSLKDNLGRLNDKKLNIAKTKWIIKKGINQTIGEWFPVCLASTAATGKDWKHLFQMSQLFVKINYAKYFVKFILGSLCQGKYFSLPSNKA